MKHLIIILLLWPLWTLAQNNPIFGGGTQDGHSLGGTETPSHNPTYGGGPEDGYAQQRRPGLTHNALFAGGTDDGYSIVRLSRPYNNPIFAGGREDGFAVVSLSKPSHNPIFGGGREDGYSIARHAIAAHNDIFAGGRDDGYDQIRFVGIPPSVNPNLPVELLSFEAWWEDDAVQLYWVSSHEYNLDHYAVERSLDAALFEPVVWRPAIGAPQEIQEYSDLDAQALVGRSYYRLKAVDLDGSWQYSQIVSVEWFPDVQLQLSLYPNPTHDVANLSLSGETEQVVQIRVIDLLGRETSVPRQRHSMNGLLKTQLDLGQLPAGIYLVQIHLEGSDTMLTQKVQKW